MSATKRRLDPSDIIINWPILPMMPVRCAGLPDPGSLKASPDRDASAWILTQGTGRIGPAVLQQAWSNFQMDCP